MSNQQLDGQVEPQVEPQVDQHVEAPRKKKRRRGCKGGKSKNFHKIFISVTGSSHANFNHYFPQLLKAKLSNDKRFECPANGWFDCRGMGHGDIRMEFYEQKYQSDVHLSKQGCQILVDLLYKKMCGGIGKF